MKGRLKKRSENDETEARGATQREREWRSGAKDRRVCVDNVSVTDVGK